MELELKNKIKELISQDKVVLFMKGTKEQPLCGFSKVVVDILNTSNISYADFNVLESPEIRQGIKEYSNWPTFPQLYVNEELVGGCDIIIELYESGELNQLFQ